MNIINLDSKKPNLDRLNHQGSESTIYICGNRLYKIFNDDVNLQLKEQSIDFLDENRDSLRGVIMPIEKIKVNGSFVGHSMNRYDCSPIDSYFSSNVSFADRYMCSIDLMSTFNRINHLGLEHDDFHADNVLIDQKGIPLIGDCTSFKPGDLSLRYKQEQLVMLLSLLSGYNLMNEVNNSVCISEIIDNLGNSSMLDYYYKPDGILSHKMLYNFKPDTAKVNSLVKQYGGM